MGKKKLKFPDELAFMETSGLPQKKTDVSMLGKITLITGATSGVGYQAARHLAAAGSDLITMVRNPQKSEELNKELTRDFGIKVYPYLADFTNLADVRETALKIRQNHPKIQVLINNAGVHMTTRQLTPEGHETAFCVNHLASFLITGLLLDTLKANTPARIIQVNSEGHRFGGLKLDDLNWEKRRHRYRGLQGYGASKTAQLMSVWELNELLKDTGVTINAMHPGAVKSNIGMNNGWLYRMYSKYLIFPILKKADISGSAIRYLASAPELEGLSGKFFNLTNEEKPAPHAQNRELGRQVFEKSKELTGLTDEANLQL